MARIAGIDLPENKRAEIGLTYIYGIGRFQANQILTECSVDKNTKIRDLSDEELSSIRSKIQSMTVEGDLRREVNLNIKRLMDLGNYRGLRHRRGLPAHGQRTKTNARTRKGPKNFSAARKKK